MNTIPLTRLRDILEYNPESGEFVWRVSLNSRAPVGSIAGTIQPSGYIRIKINGVRFMAHRLAWLWVNGIDPVCEIDHINRVRSDNRIGNLREASGKQNKENQSLRVDNTSGHKGVHWDKAREKWMVFVGHHRKFKYLGRYNDLNEAIAVADDARRKLFTHHNVI